jgi:hypothetical protein
MANPSLFASLDREVYALRRSKDRVDERDPSAVKLLTKRINAAAEAIGWDAYQRLYNLLHMGRDWNAERDA